MITEDNKKLAHWAIEFALKNGCNAARVSLYNGTSSSFEVRDMRIDKLQQASENNMIIQLFVDGRFGSFSTNRLNKTELENFILNGILSTCYLSEDRARTLPDPARFYTGGGADLQLMDPRFDAVKPDEKVALAMSVCEEIMGKDNRIISANAAYSDEKDYKYLITSNGFEGEACGSSFNVSASVSIKGENEARPEAYWFDSSICFDTLIKTGIGTKALERTLRKLGQKKIASGKYDMLVDPLCSGRLLSPVMDALYGSAIQQKNSCMLEKMDQQVFNSRMTLLDQPHQPGKVGARYFDGEGIATSDRAVFDQGVLKTYYIDTYAANKLQMEPTIASPSVLTVQPGDKNLQELIASMNKGILITGFNGGNCNSSTGDFSYGIEGFLIEQGKETQPISEMNITGNMISLWNALLDAGNDPRDYSSWRIPSLLFEGIDFSGL